MSTFKVVLLFYCDKISNTKFTIFPFLSVQFNGIHYLHIVILELLRISIL